MKKLIMPITLLALLLSGGCQVVGLMGTPTRHEKKIPAEYDLKAEKGKKIIVLVENPMWSKAPRELAKKVRTDINSYLTEAIGIKSKDMIPYETIETLQITSPDKFAAMSSTERADAVGADLLLLVELQHFSLTKVTETNYYEGQLAGQAALFETDMQQRLWPESQPGKRIRVAFDVEESSYNAAVYRLSRAFAHCTTRYLYNCLVNNFKIFEDKSDVWEKW